MLTSEAVNSQHFARYAGAALLGTIIVGILSASFIAHGIDVNMTADVAGTAENMLGAEIRLRAKAYMGLLVFGLEALFALALFYILRSYGWLLASMSLVLSLSASILVMLGSVFAMNAAEIASHAAYVDLAEEKRLMLAGLEATSDYTSFHLALVVSTVSNLGFFWLFLSSNLIPKLISGWGVFASLFVAGAIVARDFIPALGHDMVTMAFMLCNLIALVALGLYLLIKGIRPTTA